MKRKDKTRKVKRPVDAPLAKALWKAVRVSEADPGHAQIVRQQAYDLVCSRGTSGSFGDGERFAPPPMDPDMQRRQQAMDAAHWILKSALSMHTMADDYREKLADCARFFEADRPSVQNEQAAKAAAFIRERFARTARPVSATPIAKHLGVDRNIVTKYIYPLLHRDKSLTCTGRGPAAGWKPRD